MCTRESDDRFVRTKSNRTVTSRRRSERMAAMASFLLLSPTRRTRSFILAGVAKSNIEALLTLNTVLDSRTLSSLSFFRLKYLKEERAIKQNERKKDRRMIPRICWALASKKVIPKPNL